MRRVATRRATPTPCTSPRAFPSVSRVVDEPSGPRGLGGDGNNSRGPGLRGSTSTNVVGLSSPRPSTRHSLAHSVSAGAVDKYVSREAAPGAAGPRTGPNPVPSIRVRVGRGGGAEPKGRGVVGLPATRSPCLSPAPTTTLTSPAPTKKLLPTSTTPTASARPALSSLLIFTPFLPHPRPLSGAARVCV